MTRVEILSKYRVVAVRPPRKGELFISVEWFNGNASNREIVKAKRDFKRIYLEIIVPL